MLAKYSNLLNPNGITPSEEIKKNMKFSPLED